MPGTGGIGFFGKLPVAGDFLQRRLPARFVERWDEHFALAVGQARQRLGAAWADAFRGAPAWRFVLSAQVCTETAWAGLAGPSSDRVGRGFPMVMAAPLAAGPGTAVRLLDAGGAWFERLEAIYAQGQAGHLDVEAFDAATAALGDPHDVRSADTAAVLRGTDWSAADHWRLDLPAASASGAWLAELWTRLTARGEAWCLWWTRGAGAVPATVLATRGLPHADAYAAFIDPALADGRWQSPHPDGSAVVAAATAADQDITARPAAAGTVDDATVPAARGPAAAAVPPGRAAADGGETGRAALGDVHRVEAGGGQLLVICADDGHHDPRRRAAGRAAEVVRAQAAAAVRDGLEPLCGQLLELHRALRREGGGVPEDGAVVALRSDGVQAQLMRLGSAAAWLWRRGSLRPLFGHADSGGDDLDDLLFGASSAIAPGLGASSEPVCEHCHCQLEPGDRLLLLATHTLAELHEPVVHAVLARPSCEDAAASIARTCHLAGEPGRWPLAVIEVSP